MDSELNLKEIEDRAVCSLSKRVAGIEFTRVDSAPLLEGAVSSLSVLVAGDYQLSLVCTADDRLWETITRRMMRRPQVSEEEIEVCAKEFFNLLCGHIVSSVNRQARCSARFSVPEFYAGEYPVKPGSAGILECCYESSDGCAKFLTVNRLSTPLRGNCGAGRS